MAIEGLDLETLLAPISADSPTGVDVRTDFSPTSIYFRLRDARAEARTAERAADADPNAEGTSSESWRSVRNLAVTLLSEQAKDLEAAAWLAESLIRTNGLNGLAFGAELIGGLADRYWDNIYPMPDEDGMETRISPISGLNGDGGNGTLAQPLNKTRLFNNPTGEPVMLFQYQQSAELEGIADKARKEARIKAGVVPFPDMQAMARAAGAPNFVALRRAVREAYKQWTAMAETLDRVAGSDSPPTRQIGETLQTILTIVNQYAPAEAAETSGETAGEALAEPADEAGDTGGGGGGGKPKKMVTREDALAALTEVAEFFRRTEPQSPLAYTIDDAIRRGRMTWPELLGELVQDQGVRNNILNSLGIKPA
jgi:type VI secretion system protein ImpA